MSLSRRKFLAFSVATTAGLLMPKGLWAFGGSLYDSINWRVKEMRNQGLISYSTRTAWSVFDLHNNESLVEINADTPLQAASMMKIFVALAYFYLHETSPSQYPYGWEQRKAIERMLVKSSNSATNAVMRWCGGPHRVQQLCQEVTGGQFPNLYLVEYIPRGGKTYANRASANDYSRFYQLLWRNQLPNTYELKRILSMPNNDRIKVEAMPYNTTIYNKTGSTGMLCGDGGVVQLGYNNNFAYIFIGIIERDRKAGNYGHWIRSRGNAMREISEIVYYHMQSRYQQFGYSNPSYGSGGSYNGNNSFDSNNYDSFLGEETYPVDIKQKPLFDDLNQDFSSPKPFSTGTAEIYWSNE